MNNCCLHSGNSFTSSKARVPWMLIMTQTSSVSIVSIWNASTKPLTNLSPPHNSHRVSTENNRTPDQLFWCNIRLGNDYQGVLPQHPNQPNIEELATQGLPHVYVPDTRNPLGDDNFQHIHDFVMSSSGQEAMTAYRDLVDFVAEQMM